MSSDKHDDGYPVNEALNRGLDEVYDVALDPARYQTFIETWERALGPMRGQVEFGAPRLLDDPSTLRHFDRAVAILDRVNVSADGAGIQAVLSPFGRVPAMLADAQMRLRAVNDDATALFGVRAGSALTELPVSPADIPVIRRTVLGLCMGADGDGSMLRLHAEDAPGGAILVRLQRCTSNEGEPLVVIATNRIAWAEGFGEVLHDVFDLTPAETEVVRGLVELGSITEIARQRGRSVDTIRAQIKSILFKTETHSQIDLMRIVWSALDMLRRPESGSDAVPALVSRGHKTLKSIGYDSLTRPDGRRVTYLKLGDPLGRPVVYLSLDLGLARWPASAEREAARRGICVIVPVRPGYGATSPVLPKVDYDAALIDDTLHILDAEGVTRCPVLTMGDDSFYGFRLAGTQIDRFSAVIACAGVLPITRHEQFARMEKWHRNVVATAKYTPHLMMFFTKLGNWFVRRIGKRKFVDAVFGSSPADLAIFADPEVSEAMIVGSEIVLTDAFSAHEAQVRSLVGGKSGDWSADVERLKGRMPVILVNGLQDQQVHPDTLAEFRQDFDWIEYRIIEQAGQLVFFQEWRMVLDLIEEHLS